ncbi:MAG: hypothetical protein EZS28_031734, partial [Streblomastix strix]
EEDKSESNNENEGQSSDQDEESFGGVPQVKGDVKKGALNFTFVIYQRIAQELAEVGDFTDMNGDEVLEIATQSDIYLRLIKHGLEKDGSDEAKIQLIKAGIAKALLFLFKNREDISSNYSDVFYQLTVGNNQAKQQLLLENKPFRGLLSLFDCHDSHMSLDAIRSINNIIIGSNSINETDKPHPEFKALVKADGIEKIYSLFKGKGNKIIKDHCAICIGIIYRAQEIDDPTMKKEIIGHLKSLVKSGDGSIKDNAKLALKCLSQNSQNSEEIKKEGFEIPE